MYGFKFLLGEDISSYTEEDRLFVIGTSDDFSNNESDEWEFEKVEDCDDIESVILKAQLLSGENKHIVYGVFEISNLRGVDESNNMQSWSLYTLFINGIAVMPQSAYAELYEEHQLYTDVFESYDEWMIAVFDELLGMSEEKYNELSDTERLEVITSYIAKGVNAKQLIAEAGAYVFNDFVKMIQQSKYEDLIRLIGIAQTVSDTDDLKQLVDNTSYLQSRDYWIERGYVVKDLLKRSGMDSAEVLDTLQTYRILSFRSENQPLRIWASVVKLYNGGDWLVYLPPALVDPNYKNDFEYGTHLGQTCLPLRIPSDKNTASKKVKKYIGDYFAGGNAVRDDNDSSYSFLNNESYPKLSVVISPSIRPGEFPEITDWEIAE